MTLMLGAKQHKNYGIRAFLWGLLLAGFLVVPVMIYDHGYFLYYGDFNAQQIPFYQLAHDTILSGDIGWSHITDLGANFIGSYSFYVLGSPFFLLTLLLPSSWVAYAIGPLLILKLGCCSLSAYIFLRRYVRDKRYAVLGGLLYAFSGFSLYNIFYFHFHEAMIVFPLLLAALDEFHRTKRRGVVMITIFAAAAVNYYFFFAQAVFLLIYYIVRLITKTYRFRIKEFLLLALEVIVGVLLAMFIMLPSLAAVFGNSRSSEFINGWGALLYPGSQRYLQIIIAFFFPGDLPAKANFTPNASGKWASVAAYLPMFSMVFVIAFFRRYKKSFINILFTILVVMAFVPVFNAAFQAFNNVYYARWFYMLTLVMTLMTVYSLDNIKECEFKKGFIPTALTVLIITAAIGLTPYEVSRTTEKVVYHFGLENSPKYFWLFAGITIAGLGAVLALYIIHRKKPKLYPRLLCISLCVFILGYSCVYTWSAKRQSNHKDDFLQHYALNGGEDITLGDLKDVRSDFYQTQDNIAMYWQVPSIQAFHSIVPGSLMNFYNQSGVKRDVGSRPEPELYGFRGLLSVKYLFSEATLSEKDKPQMPYFKYLRTENGYDIYENAMNLPMGFTFDSYLTREEYLNLSDKVKHLALLKGLVLTQEQMEKYADITGYTDGMYDKLNEQFDESELQDLTYPKYDGFKSATDSYEYNTDAYKKDIETLSKNVCSRFEYVNGGFDAEFDNKGGDNLLFFSVPYDEGWSATVNGEPAEIEIVDIGMMAVKVNGHEKSVIEFRYKTPLLKEGIILSLSGLCMMIAYLIINKGFSAKKKYRKCYHIKKSEPSDKEVS